MAQPIEVSVPRTEPNEFASGLSMLSLRGVWGQEPPNVPEHHPQRRLEAPEFTPSAFRHPNRPTIPPAFQLPSETVHGHPNKSRFRRPNHPQRHPRLGAF